MSRCPNCDTPLSIELAAKPVSPAKAEAKPEAGTAPPEGMPEALREKWDSSQRVYRKHYGRTAPYIYRMYPANVSFVTNETPEILETRLPESEAGTLLPNRPAPTPSPQAAEVAEKLEAWWNGQVRTTADLIDLVREVRRLQPTREMPASVKFLLGIVDNIAEGLCKFSATDNLDAAIQAVHAEYSPKFTTTPTPATAPDAYDFDASKSVSCNRPAPDAVPVAPTELQAAALEMLIVIDEMESGGLAQRANDARAKLIAALEPHP